MSKGLVEKAEMLIAIRGYEKEKRKKWDDGVDLITSPEDSDDKVLFRVITRTKSKYGITGVATVKDIGKNLQLEDYDKVVLVSNSFTSAARKELREKNIEIISNNLMPHYSLEKIYAALQEYINSLCQTKCAKIPKDEQDCKGYSNGNYLCKIRRISDNVSFHLKNNWKSLLQNDLKQLLALNLPES